MRSGCCAAGGGLRTAKEQRDDPGCLHEVFVEDHLKWTVLLELRTLMDVSG